MRVEISNSSPGVGTLDVSAVEFTAGDLTGKTVTVRPAASGTTVLGVVTPAGFVKAGSSTEVAITVN